MPPAAIPTIEVFIFCFNHERFLSQAVQSVLSQEGSFHLIVTIVDDNSSDKSVELLRNIKEQHKNVDLFLHKKNRFTENPSFFFDYIKSSKADFLAILSADDYWTDKSKLQKQMMELKKYSHASMAFHDYVIDINNIVFSSPIRRNSNSRLIQSLHRKNIVGSMTVLMRPQLALAGLESFITNGVLEDYVIWSNAIRNGPGIHIREKMAAYRVHADNRWATESSLKKLKDLEVTQQHIASVVFSGKAPKWNLVVRSGPVLRPVRLSGLIFQETIISLLSLWSRIIGKGGAIRD